MKALKAILKATALEIIADPLSLLLLSAALTITSIAPKFYCHQFGEPTRMAKDAGSSALLVIGIIFGVVGAIRVFRREIESGTAELALSHAVSRRVFYFSKVLGVFSALMLFVAIVLSDSLIMVAGAEIGGRTLGIPEMNKVAFACAMTTLFAPAVLSAFLNRFLNFRFCLTTFVLTGCFGLITAIGFLGVLPAIKSGYKVDIASLVNFAKQMALYSALIFIPVSVASALAANYKTNISTTFTVISFLAIFPLIANFSSVAQSAPILFATAMIIAGVLILGSEKFKKRERL